MTAPRSTNTSTVAPPFLRIVVHGTPGTAGSKSAFPIYRGTGANRTFVRTAVTEQPSKVKTSWRLAVTDAVLAEIRCCDDPDCTKLAPGYPLDEPLEAAMVFTVAKPVSAPKTRRTWPRGKPDLIKYARATEDHMKAAGVMKDDARIVRYRDLAKVYPGEDLLALPAPGVVVALWRVRDLVDLAAPVVAGDAQASLFEATS